MTRGHRPVRLTGGGIRLLHTGDWHLGKRLYGADRAEEAEAVLAQLAAVAEEESVDAVLVSGDLLDRRVVDSAALGACLRGLERLAETAPVLAVAGNHDDPDLWAHLAPHLAASGIHVAGHVRPAAEAIVTVTTAAGPLHAALLPWPEPGRIALDAGAGAGYARSRYADLVADVIDDYAAEAVARRRAEGGAAVLVGHLMVERARAGGGERELTMGMTYAVSPGALPVELDYLALGHVHRPQELTGLAAPGRYCGSPMALDFSEDNHPKTACVVEVGGGRATTRQVALQAARPLVRLRGRLDDLAARASAHPPDAWFACEVELDGPAMDVVRRVRDEVPGALRIEAVSPGGLADPLPEPGGAEAERGLGELYADWHRLQGRRLGDEQAAAFSAALAGSDPAAAGDEG
jgi:DNA repair protein SbcD/Mre11